MRTEIFFDEDTLSFSFLQGRERWSWRRERRPRLVCREGIFEFADARRITHEKVKTGIGSGIRSRFEGFLVNGEVCGYAFETYVWTEDCTGDVYCEWIPVCEEGLTVTEVYWPGEMAFDEPSSRWYTLLNEQQGLLIPNTWETALKPLSFRGRFETAGGYMPWFAQVRDRAGYLAICTTPWNAGCEAEHPANGPYTHVGIRLESSLGRMEYRRIVRYTFLPDCDYNDICKGYRRYVQEKGTLTTLAQKAAKTPAVNKLVGCAVVHAGIKTEVQPESDSYDPAHPERNHHVTPFSVRKQEMEKLHRLGVKKLYLHLDGWAQPGYDNRHPDYTPACKEAGGWEGMKELADTMRELGYLFGIHDQYRDYYVSAPSFDEACACRLTDGSIPMHHRWAGGLQSYLCAALAPFYVKRNFTVLREQGIHLDAAYLDVFTCNEGDECANPQHRMTRRECYEYRGQCFEYLLSQGILPSSEEVSDWSIPSLVFCHYAPYDFMMRRPGTPKQGIPVPLYNLVYHDCVMIPWMMDRVSDEEDYMLYALLNGGLPYLYRGGAYADIDGSFEGGQDLPLEEQISRCRIVTDLHERVAMCEMVRHEMVNGNPSRQRTVFSDGTTVTVDFETQAFRIDPGQKGVDRKNG